MKDFYDLKELGRRFDFDGPTLVAALRATFQRRNTPFPGELLPALTAEYFGDPRQVARWQSFAEKAGIGQAGTLEQTVGSVRTFVREPIKAARLSSDWTASWRAGGPWRR